MAGFRSVAAVGESLCSRLESAFGAHDAAEIKRAKATLIRSGDFRPGGSITEPCVSLFLYRVDFNKVTRPGWSAVGSLDGRAYLPVDLHYLLTAWADNARHEHELLGFALELLETSPTFSGPDLLPAGAWHVGEAVQVTLEDVPTDDLMRIFDSLRAPYRLSVPYLARVVVLQTPEEPPHPFVVDALLGVAPPGVVRLAPVGGEP